MGTLTLGKPAPTNSIEVSQDKAAQLQQLAAMSAESLRILADLSKKPGIEKALKENAVMLKLML